MHRFFTARFCTAKASASFSGAFFAGITATSTFFFLCNSKNTRNDKQFAVIAYCAELEQEQQQRQQPEIPVTYCPDTGREIHTLVPPCLDGEDNIGGFIPCQRPTRVGGPRVEVEKIVVEVESEAAELQIPPQRQGDQAPGDEPTTNEQPQPKQPVVEKFNRTVYHNYGHGGGGWSNGPGCVAHIMRLFDASRTDENSSSSKEEPIAVIGSGAIGLFTAFSLLMRGFNNVAVFTDRDHDLCSHNAAGLFGVFQLGADGDEERTKMFERAATTTLDFYGALLLSQSAATNESNENAANNNSSSSNNVNQTVDILSRAFDNSAVKIVPRYMGRQDMSEDVQPLIDHGYLKPSKEIFLRFSESGYIRRAWVMDAVFIDVQKMMLSLEHAVFSGEPDWLPRSDSDSKAVKAHKVLRHIERLDRVSCLSGNNDDENNDSNNAARYLPSKFKTVFNCSGAAAKELLAAHGPREAAKLSRTGGHTVALANQPKEFLEFPPYVLDYMHREGTEASYNVAVPGSGGQTRKTVPMMYFVPKGQGLLGGSLVHNMEPDEMFSVSQFERIVDDAKALFYGSAEFN